MQCVYTCESWGLAFTSSRILGAVMPSTGNDMKSYHSSQSRRLLLFQDMPELYIPSCIL